MIPVTFMLIAVFWDGSAYTERRGLSLQECAGWAAMTRAKTESVDLVRAVGRVKYLCIPEARS